jgi:predicted PolB exonuclease-like 3'-5' exonuclease
MYDLNAIKKCLFIDIETVAEYKNLDELRKHNPHKADLWISRCNYLRRRYIENENLTSEQLYEQKAGLHAEYAKIVCISAGLQKSESLIQVVSYFGHDEAVIIKNAFALMQSFMDKAVGGRIAGYNIKRFDIPVISKRAIINKINIPLQLQTHKLKPWEMPFIDLAEDWSFGAWQEGFTSLDLLTCVLGIPSPKDDIKASEVQNVYYNTGDVNRIRIYCEKDVSSTINTMRVFSDLPIMTDDQIQILTTNK